MLVARMPSTIATSNGLTAGATRATSSAIVAARRLSTKPGQLSRLMIARKPSGHTTPKRVGAKGIRTRPTA